MIPADSCDASYEAMARCLFCFDIYCASPSAERYSDYSFSPLKAFATTFEHGRTWRLFSLEP